MSESVDQMIYGVSPCENKTFFFSFSLFYFFFTFFISFSFSQVKALYKYFTNVLCSLITGNLNLSISYRGLVNRNLSRVLQIGIIAETFLSELRRLVVDGSNTQAQAHAAGTIRNLAAGEHVQVRPKCR